MQRHTTSVATHKPFKPPRRVAVAATAPPPAAATTAATSASFASSSASTSASTSFVAAGRSDRSSPALPRAAAGSGGGRAAAAAAARHAALVSQVATSCKLRALAEADEDLPTLPSVSLLARFAYTPLGGSPPYGATCAAPHIYACHPPPCRLVAWPLRPPRRGARRSRRRALARHAGAEARPPADPLLLAAACRARARASPAPPPPPGVVRVRGWPAAEARTAHAFSTVVAPRNRIQVLKPYTARTARSDFKAVY